MKFLDYKGITFCDLLEHPVQTIQIVAGCLFIGSTQLVSQILSLLLVHHSILSLIHFIPHDYHLDILQGFLVYFLQPVSYWIEAISIGYVEDDNGAYCFL